MDEGEKDAGRWRRNPVKDGRPAGKRKCRKERERERERERGERVRVNFERERSKF